MEKRIVLECRGKEPSQVTDLSLDNVRSVGEFEGLTDQFVNLEKLSVTKAGLVSLKGFPKLPKLKKLDVSENRISNGLNLLKDCTSLNQLCLSSNKFKDFEALEHLKGLENLSHLEIGNNPLCEEDDIRNRIFEQLPQLRYLDGQDRDGNDASDDEDEEDDDEDDEVGQNGLGQSGDENEDGDDEDGIDEEDEDEEEEEEEEEDEEDDDGPGLADLYNNTNLQEGEDEDGDYDEAVGEDEEEDDLEDEEVEEEEPSTRGKKRKCEDGDTA